MTAKVFVRYKTVLFLTKTFMVETSYAAVICYVKAHQHYSAINKLHEWHMYIHNSVPLEMIMVLMLSMCFMVLAIIDSQ